MTLPRISLFVMVLFSFVIALGSYRFLALGLPMAFQDMLGHIEFRRLAFVTHVSTAPLALVFGSMQLLPSLRARHPAVHRWTGRLYGVSVLLAGLTGLVVASGAAGGLSTQLGFGLLSVLWLVVTALGVWHARARRFAEHRRWMIRSFALTFTGVTLRLYLLIFIGAGFTYTEASVYLAWLGWIPNLVAVEWWLRRRPSPHLPGSHQAYLDGAPDQSTA